MAVAQGYGKTVTSGSVFAYDTGDTRNSYIGEPTTNLIPSPTVNALPTTGNSWGTYNTNQYCGNNGCGNYWDLATVSSVSSNIVTTSTGHGLRTFDVINPQTTGGGVTAGTQYFVKVISSTQFSLHAYNGSQDGSQGYINTATGKFKVHDSIWLDQKVSINSSSFPTRWFGNPHQPNSGLVKEIITNGYDVNPNKKTDCIRLHVPRTAGVDGMAYGADAGVTIGQPVTTSFWLRAVNANAVGRSIYFQNYNYGGVGGANSFGFNSTLGPVGEWQRFSMTFTPTHNTLISYWFPPGDYIYDFDLANIQIEQKDHVTPFVAGTRSATQGLLPLVGNSSLDLSGTSFNSNAQIAFDGTDDYITIGNFTNKPTTAITCEAIIKPTKPSVGTGTHRGGAISSGNSMYLGIIDSTDGGNTFSMHWANQTNSSRVYNWNGQIPNNQYSHLVGTYDGATARAYLNGVEIWSTSQSGTIPDATYYIATYGGTIVDGTHNFNGEIPVAKIYNRALSAGEVRQNYLHYKTRFNLS